MSTCGTQDLFSSSRVTRLKRAMPAPVSISHRFPVGFVVTVAGPIGGLASLAKDRRRGVVAGRTAAPPRLLE